MRRTRAGGKGATVLQGKRRGGGPHSVIPCYINRTNKVNEVPPQTPTHTQTRSNDAIMAPVRWSGRRGSTMVTGGKGG